MRVCTFRGQNRSVQTTNERLGPFNEGPLLSQRMEYSYLGLLMNSGRKTLTLPSRAAADSHRDIL